MCNKYIQLARREQTDNNTIISPGFLSISVTDFLSPQVSTGAPPEQKPEGEVLKIRSCVACREREEKPG